ncbi:MAG TPA: FAD binding domain-containing protein [Bacteroidia bacterium]|nr:FAD binding domain-containing protein [Bacteroidia bacterium]
MIAEKTYLKPKTVEEAIALAAENKNSFRYLAGGTDVIVNKFQGNVEADCLIDISDIEEFKKITIDGKLLKIGSLIRLDELKKYPEIKNKFPSLIQAAHEVASPMIRKTATLGGNILCENRCIFYNQSEWWRTAVGYCLKCDGDICIATGGTKACFSKFVSDTAPVLIACDAQIEIADIDGIHITKLEEIYTGDGINPRYLSRTALIKSVLLPLDMQYQCVFKKLRPREAVDFTSLTTVVSLNEKGKIKIVLGGVDPKPIVVKGSSSDKKENLIQQAMKKPRIVDNDYYSRSYRKEMISVFLDGCFNELSLK